MNRSSIAALLLMAAARIATAYYAIGETPDDFTCSDWNGNTWSLYEQRGKIVFITFGARG